MVGAMNVETLSSPAIPTRKRERRAAPTHRPAKPIRRPSGGRCGYALAFALATSGWPVMYAATETATSDDAAVLAACLAAIHQDAHAQTPAPALQSIHVMPKGERRSAELDKQRLARTFPGLDWSRANPAIDAIHRRSAGDWNPPASLPDIGVPVQVRKPPRKRLWFKTPFFVAFWPPGYGIDDDYALVLATFGPSDHGSIAACQLQRENGGGWAVDRKWVLSYL